MGFLGTFVNSILNTEGSARSNGFSWSTTAEEVLEGKSLEGKNYVVTGANTGIGYETARTLANAGASSVVLACRNPDLGSEAAEKIKAQLPAKEPKANIRCMTCDLASLESVRSFAAAYNKLKLPLHGLVCNAGVMACPYTETKDGFEMQFGTNHLGHFLLVNQLMGSLRAATDGARVVVVSSAAHRFSPVIFDDLSGKGTWYKGTLGSWKSYGQSKTANSLFAVELDRRMREAGVPITANSLHPGSIYTDLQRHVTAGWSPWFFQLLFSTAGTLMKSVPQGAATSVFLAASDKAGGGGRYFSDSNPAKPKPYATDPANAMRLWELSEQMVGIKK